MKKIPLHDMFNTIKGSVSLLEVIKKLGFKASGTYYRYLHKIIKENNVDISHFLGRCHNKGKYFGPKRDINDYLSGKHFINTHALKLKLIKQGLKKHKCEVCGITEWQGKLTPIQLDHINGNNSDNRLENLRILCPNCHAQTDTYCGKKTKKIRYCVCGNIKGSNSKVCTDCAIKGQYKNIKNINIQSKACIYDYCKCGNPKLVKSKLCKLCNDKKEKYYCRKVKRPPKHKILELIYTMPFTHIGKMFGVSDNAVRKWCKAYNIPYKKKEIKKHWRGGNGCTHSS